MGFKKLYESFTFADLAMKETLAHNRSLKTVEKVDKTIHWSSIESILLSHYTVGTSGEGADAYPPLLLYKCSFKNGSGFSPTPNWKTKSTTGFLLNDFWVFPLIDLPRIIPPFPGSEAGFPKTPWIKSTPKSSDNSNAGD